MTLTPDATPAEVHAHLASLLSEDAHLRYQQTLGDLVLAEAVEDAGAVRAAAENEGLYNANWREGWDDGIQRIDPDHNAPTPHRLLEVKDDALDQADTGDFGSTADEYRLSTTDTPGSRPHNFTAERRLVASCVECSQPVTATVHDGDQSPETRMLRDLLQA